MDFAFLYDATRELFSIGLKRCEHRLDASSYDLAGLRGTPVWLHRHRSRPDLPEHWFALDVAGRASRRAGAGLWSGSILST